MNSRKKGLCRNHMALHGGWIKQYHSSTTSIYYLITGVLFQC